jgi:hypothetical protein
MGVPGHRLYDVVILVVMIGEGIVAGFVFRANQITSFFAQAPID